MNRKRLITTIGGTALCALGIGFFMQKGGVAQTPAIAPQPAPIQQAVLVPIVAPDPGTDDVLDLGEIILTSTQPVQQAPLPLPVPQLEKIDRTEECDVTASASTGALASVDLKVSAPCFGNERVTVHHSGMMFTGVTDTDGMMSVTVPALSKKAVFVVAFANGKGAVATAKVPTLGDFDRVVLQWTGDSGFQVHAREFGAAYGDAGHIWSGADQAAAQSDNGSVIRLGTAGTLAPQLAEVYTFPTGTTSMTGTVALSIEAEVTTANCGRDIAAQTLELRGASSLRTRDLVLSVPNCGAVGDFLVLNNLVDDLKIAVK